MPGVRVLWPAGSSPDRPGWLSRGMRRSIRRVAGRVAACATAAMLLGSACTYYEAPPPSYPASPAPSVFDRAWNAAVGAAYDEGVEVTVQDRGSGLIRGTKGSSTVEISVRTQADGSVRVAINARGGGSRDSALADQINQSYDRRMGR
jgi:hypothetical protein